MREKNRIAPNSVQVPSLFFTHVMPLVSGMEWKIISLVISRTYMAGLAAAPLSTREIAEAIGAEKSINSTHKALQRLQVVGLLVVVEEGAGRRPARWGLQQDETQIDWPILAEGNEDSAAVAFLSEEHNDDICVPLTGTQRLVFLSGEHNSVPLTGTQNLAFPSEEQKGESCVPLTGTQNGLCSSQGNTTPPLNKSIYIDKESNSSFSRKEKTRPRKRTRGEEDRGVLAVWNDVLSLVDGDEEAAGSILLLKNHFCEVTGIAGPPIDIRAERRRLGDEWWPYLKHYLDAAGGDLDLAKLAVEKGAEELTKFRRGSVCAPKSLRNKVPALIPTLRQAAVVEEELTGLRFY